MYNDHFNLKEHPFSSAPSPEFIFHSRELREALAHFRFAIENREAFLMMTGEVGTGKTTAVQALLRLLPEGTPVAVVNHTTLRPRELLEEICARFGVPLDGATTKPALVRRLEEFCEEQWGAGRQSLLILDEAHLLSVEVLEEVRLLSNLEREGGKLMQICLVGQPELVAHLQRTELRQLRQRISVRYMLRPLSREETRDYLEHRLRAAGSPHPNRVFTADGIDVVHQLTGGIPREINVVASQSMLNAFLENRAAVSGRLVASVGQDYGFEGLRMRRVQPTAATGDRPGPPPPPLPRVMPRASAGPPPPPLPSFAPPPPAVSPPPVPAASEPAPGSVPGPGPTEAPGSVPPPEPSGVGKPEDAPARRPRPRPIPLPPAHLRPGSEAESAAASPQPEERDPEPVHLAGGPGLADPWADRPSRREPLVWGILIGVIAVAALWIFWQGTRGAAVSPGDATAPPATEFGRAPASAAGEGVESGAGGRMPGPGETRTGTETASGAETATPPGNAGAPLGETPVPDPVAAPRTGAGETSGAPRVRVVGDRAGTMTAQIASFRSESNARRIQESITRRLGLPGDVLVAEVNGSRWYRICLGTFESTDEAAAALRPLVRDGTIDEIVLVPLPESWSR